MVQVGGPNTLDSFNAALRGATVGQQLKFQVSYPPHFGERQLAGKRAAYDLEVKGIKKKIEPEMNDEFAKELGTRAWKTSRGPARTPGRYKQRHVQNETTNRLLDALVNCFEFRCRSRWCSSRSMRAWIVDCARWLRRACVRKTCAILISIACGRRSAPRQLLK